MVIDECTMMTAPQLELIDRTLQAVRGNSQRFGGLAVVLAGDFRQIGPVVQHGTMTDSEAVSWINPRLL